MNGNGLITYTAVDSVYYAVYEDEYDRITGSGSTLSDALTDLAENLANINL